MPGHNTHHTWKDFVLRIILPTAIVIALFVSGIFTIITPTFRQQMMAHKRQMLAELTSVAISACQDLHIAHQQGRLTQEQAQSQAVEIIRTMRYGDEHKDYFWITDTTPRMIMHPYRTDLEGKDVSEFADPTGKHLFAEFVREVSADGRGYVDYMWQWKDDPERIVPKLSYVQTFEPWGWIIGTGIYIEDVQQEIAQLVRGLLIMSLAVLVVISLLLGFITLQSVRIEKQRRSAVEQLSESKERYQALVEAATEGLIMVIGGQCVYANRTMLDMLGYAEDEFVSLDVESLFADEHSEDTTYDTLTATLSDSTRSRRFEGRLVRKDGSPYEAMLTVSPIVFAGRSGVIIIAHDLSPHKDIEEQLVRTRAQYDTLTESINIGVFRADLASGNLIEANVAACSILGLSEKGDDWSTINVFDMLGDTDDSRTLLDTLQRDGVVRDSILQVQRSDGTSPLVSLSAVSVEDESDQKRYCDAVVEDITERTRTEEERERLIAELQTALLFLNRPIRQSASDIVTCPLDTPIRKAAALMHSQSRSALAVTAESGQCVGIVTDNDISHRAVAAGVDLDRPVYEIMSSPVIAISQHALVFEAMLLMQDKDIRHLAVRDDAGNVVSIITNKEMLDVQRYSSALLLRQIGQAQSVEDVCHIQQRLARLVKALVDSGSTARNVTRIISAVSDAIADRLVTLAIHELGTPPVDFVFLAMGSEGREEQTLCTDQDNAIVFADVDESAYESTREYFHTLGQKVCEYLHKCGYNYCEGDVMAQNPRWTQSLSIWKQYFTEWINNADPQDLLDVSIFFDFRGVCGSDMSLADQLRTHVHQATSHKAAFLQHMAKNTISLKSPVGMFGGISVRSGGQHGETFNVKMAMRPLIEFARVYALRHTLNATNTLDRLRLIHEAGVLNRTDYNDTVDAYNVLMQLRFKHQAEQLNESTTCDNEINPKKLSGVEQTIVKKALNQISLVQNRLGHDFTGVT